MNSVLDFFKMKQAQQKISMITCYDYTSAKIIDDSDIDCVLVGDSVSMVMHGYPDTTHATIKMMETHVAAVARGLTNKFMIGDLPFMSYRKSLSKSMQAIQTLIQAGANSVKLEGADQHNLTVIRHSVESGAPVMGHIGLTPQHIHQLGGWKVQGKGQSAQQALIQQAKELEQAGCFCVVLECVPDQLAAEVTAQLAIPTIGIGAGANTDGQVLVWQDLLGLQTQFKPKFLKHFLQGADIVKQSINQYNQEVKARQYPGKEHSYEG